MSKKEKVRLLSKTPVRKLRSDEVDDRPPKLYDEPGCCNMAWLIATWMDASQREFPSPHDTIPNTPGWMHYVEAGGPGIGSEWVPVHFCPFCGTKLDGVKPKKR